MHSDPKAWLHVKISWDAFKTTDIYIIFIYTDVYI